jgi:hypothetical protein
MWHVVEAPKRLIGSIQARILRPGADADWQLVRELGRLVLKIRFACSGRSSAQERRRSSAHGGAETWGEMRGASEAVVIAAARSPTGVPFCEQGMGYMRKTIGFWKNLSR